jgi:hypothetical protein
MMGLERLTEMTPTGLFALISTRPTSQYTHDTQTNQEIDFEGHLYCSYNMFDLQEDRVIEEIANLDFSSSWNDIPSENYAYKQHNLDIDDILDPLDSDDTNLLDNDVDSFDELDDYDDVLDDYSESSIVDLMGLESHDLLNIPQSLWGEFEELYEDFNFQVMGPKKTISSLTKNNFISNAFNAGFTVYSFDNSAYVYSQPTLDTFIVHIHKLFDENNYPSPSESVNTYSSQMDFVYDWNIFTATQEIEKQNMRKISNLYAIHNDDERFFQDIISRYTAGFLPSQELNKVVQNFAPVDFLHQQQYFSKFTNSVKNEDYEQASVLLADMKNVLVPLFAEVRENHLRHINRKRFNLP